MKKRVISLMLVLVTVIGLLPLSLLAADTTASETTETVDAAQYLENAGIPRKDIIGATGFEGFSDAQKEYLRNYVRYREKFKIKSDELFNEPYADVYEYGNNDNRRLYA